MAEHPIDETLVRGLLADQHPDLARLPIRRLDAGWVHGDLHAQNVLVQHGRLSGIIDWGDITAGDVATDLASIWMLFAETAARQDALACYGRSQATDDARKTR